MKPIFLGTAAATSMPLLFCHCPVCTAARTNGGKDLRKRSAALVNDDLLKPGENMWQLLRGHRLDVAVLDCTCGEGFNAGGHIDAGQLRDIVAQMRCTGIADEHTRIYATHISHEGNDTHDRMEQSSLPFGYHIAYDGLVINIRQYYWPYIFIKSTGELL